VIFSLDLRRTTQCRHVTKILSPQPLLFPALTNCDARNSFRFRSYENCRGAYPSNQIFSISPFLFPLPFLDVSRSNLQGVNACFALSLFFSIHSGYSCTTATHQPLCNQFVTHSFHRDGGCTPPSPKPPSQFPLRSIKWFGILSRTGRTPMTQFSYLG
jgi:hypothetical protein